MTDSPQDRDSDGATVIFLHIGKTGGSSFRQVVRRQFQRSKILSFHDEIASDSAAQPLDAIPSGEPHEETPADPPLLPRERTLTDFAQLPEERRRRMRLIEGHTIFGVHRFVPRPSTYITLLRDPVALALSQYRFVLRRPRHPLHALARELSLDDYVKSGKVVEMDNSQTRALSGTVCTPFGASSQQMLESAKRNLDEHFAVVGLTERFDETLILLRRAFGWSRLHYVRANVAPRRGGDASVPASTIALIEEQNWLDRQLYDYAARRFHEVVSSDALMERQLRQLKLANRLYRPWGLVSYEFPRRLARAGSTLLRARQGR